MLRWFRFLFLLAVLLSPLTAFAQETRPRQDRVYQGELVTLNHPAGWGVRAVSDDVLLVTNARDVLLAETAPASRADELGEITLNNGEIIIRLQVTPLAQALSVGAARDLIAGDAPEGALPQPLKLGTRAAYLYTTPDDDRLIVVYKPTGEVAVRADVFTPEPIQTLPAAVQDVLASVRTGTGDVLAAARLPNTYIAPNAALRVNYPNDWVAVELDDSSLLVATSFQTLFGYFDEEPFLSGEFILDIYLPNEKELALNTAEIIDSGDLPDNTEITEVNGQQALLTRYPADDVYVYLFDLPTGRPVRVRVVASQDEIDAALPMALDVATSLSTDIPAPQTMPPLTQTFTGRNVPVQFRYPAGWAVREFDNGNVVLNNTEVTDEFEDLVPGEIDIIVQVNDRYPRIAGENNDDRARYAAEQWIRNQISDTLPYRTIDVIDLGGMTTAYTRVYSEVIAEIPEDWMLYFVMADDERIVTVSVLAYPNELYLNEPTVRAILSTLTVYD